MARKAIDFDVNASTPIEQVVDDYIEYKSQEKEITSKTGALNKTLKAYFKEHEDESKLEGENGVVAISYREKAIYDEASMIEALRNVPGCAGIVKTKEYIDFDALESALYNGRIKDSGIDIKKFMTIQTTPVLTIKKAR